VACWDARVARLNAAFADNELPLEAANIVSVVTLGYTVPSRYNWMFQFYLRAHGLALNWTGTGRLIFSHDYTDADFDAVIDAVVAAGHAMRRDGWWWMPVGQTNRRIGRQIGWEMLKARLAR